MDVLSSRPELITKSISSAGAAHGSSPGRGRTHAPNALAHQAEQAAPRPEPPGGSQGRGFCVCCLDVSRGKKVPSPSMKTDLTVGELGERFAACLRRGHPFPFELRPTSSTQKSASGNSQDNLRALPVPRMGGVGEREVTPSQRRGFPG